MQTTQKSIANITNQERRIFLKWAATQVQQLPLAVFNVAEAEAQAIYVKIFKAMQVLVKSVEGKIQPRNVVRCVARAVKADMAKANEMVVTVTDMLYQLFCQWVGVRTDSTRMLAAYTRKHCAWRTVADGQVI